MSDMVISNRPDAVCGAVEQILSELLRFGVSNESFYDVKLILSELFVNALTHGNKNDPSKKIMIFYSIDELKFVFTITDEGGGFDYNNLHDPSESDNLVKLSGRGLFLVKHLSDSVVFNSTGNSVSVEKIFI